jgi:hypothetical protein
MVAGFGKAHKPGHRSRFVRWLPLLGALCVLSAGCLGGNEGGDGDPDGLTPATGTPGPGTGPDGNGTSTPATVAAPPAWTVGQSWTWRITGSALTEPVEGTTVVVAADGATYDVGVADVAGGAALFPFHVVGIGGVDAGCLCWQAHGHSVELLRFPLADGTRFTTDFWAAPGAQVVLNATEVAGPDGPEAGFRAVASYAGGGTFLQADYAPARGQFVRVATYFGGSEPFAEAQLVSQTMGATGIPFHATELARYTASAADPSSLAPHPVNVPNGSDIVLLACFLPAADGAYFVELSTAALPLACGGASQERTTYAGTHTAATAGPGSVTAAVGGQGSINVEVFAVDTTA